MISKTYLDNLDFLIESAFHHQRFEYFFFKGLIRHKHVQVLRGKQEFIAAVTIRKSIYTGKYDYHLLLHEDFFSETPEHKKAILYHEFFHVVLNHSTRKMKLMNIDPTFNELCFLVSADMVVNYELMNLYNRVLYKALPFFTQDSDYVNFKTVNKMFPGLFRSEDAYSTFIRFSSLEDIYFTLKRWLKVNQQDSSTIVENNISHPEFVEEEEEEKGNSDEVLNSESGNKSGNKSGNESGNDSGNESSNESEEGSDSKGSSGSLQEEVEKLNQNLISDYVESRAKDGGKNLGNVPLETHLALENHFSKFANHNRVDLNDLIPLTIQKSIHLTNLQNWRKIVSREYKKWKGEGIEDVWGRMDRRFSALSLSGLILPSELDHSGKEEKPTIHLFLDRSGSCFKLLPFFNKLSISIPKEIGVKAYMFASECLEVPDPRLSRKELKGNVLGNGTDFSKIIEVLMDKFLEEGKLPQPVVLVTDGCGIPLESPHHSAWHHLSQEVQNKLSRDEFYEYIKSWYWMYFGAEVKGESTNYYTISYPYRTKNVIYLPEMISNFESLGINVHKTSFTDWLKHNENYDENDEIFFSSQLVDKAGNQYYFRRYSSYY